MKQYYLDTSVLLVYTLNRGIETTRFPAVENVFEQIQHGKIKAVTSFYALHEVYLFAIDHAPDIEIGGRFGKEAIRTILMTDVYITPLLTRIERKIHARLFKKLPDSSDLPHVISGKIWGCDGIIAYDEHFRSITDVLEYKTPEEIVAVKEKEEE